MIGRSLRAELLVNLGFVTSSAVILVGLNTVLLLGGDPGEAWRPLAALWAGSTLVFLCFSGYLVHRLVLHPLRQLAAEADTLAQGKMPSLPAAYETRELTELAQRYRVMAEELLDAQSHLVRAEKLAGIGRLAAGVAHEIRNPLGAVGNYTEVLRRRGSDPAVIMEMHAAIARMDRIVQGLLDYARPARNGHPDHDAAPRADLNAAVGAAVRSLEAQGVLPSGSITVSLVPDLEFVRGESHGLEQVVINLLVNAAQAAPGGPLAVGTTRQRYEVRRSVAGRGHEQEPGDGHAARRTWSPRPRRRDLAAGTPGVMLYVADSGPGIPEADRDRVFDPFFTTKAPGEGVGLGLAIVARTVHEAGGVVWVDRAREGGAVFKVFLPLAGGTDACPDR